MREVDRIAGEFERACAGDPWYGPPLSTVLAGIGANAAVSRPIAGAHSICEIVLHMTGWVREVARRLRDGIAREPEHGDWPACTVRTESDWQAVVAGLDAANAELLTAIRAADDARLAEQIGDAREPSLGTGVTRYVTLHGIVQHQVYHAGQISLLKKVRELESS
jgi:uncharacterized damage-inducible protein DinB